ncbi:unnamed protein product [[Candida] boidinii]|nr:unnamed protein product [[Candida] boidinii]
MSDQQVIQEPGTDNNSVVPEVTDSFSETASPAGVVNQDEEGEQSESEEEDNEEDDEEDEDEEDDEEEDDDDGDEEDESVDDQKETTETSKTEVSADIEEEDSEEESDEDAESDDDSDEESDDDSDEESDEDEEQTNETSDTSENKLNEQAEEDVEIKDVDEDLKKSTSDEQPQDETTQDSSKENSKSEPVAEESNNDDEDDYDPTSPSEQFNQNTKMPSNDEQEDKKSETEAEDDNYDPLKALDIEEETKDDGGDNNDNIIDDNDVAIFNQVISFFITSSLLTDPEFDSLTPSEKSQKVVEEYNKAHNTNLKLKLNFAATTSYNKKFLKQNDTPVKLIPLNPFCLRPDITVPMTEKEEKLYSEYKESENYILETGRWDEFPIGSRLFIGNLAVNTLNPDDVYRVFSAYGVVKQVNLKQGFGFVQFDKAESCSRAIQGEKNVPLHNKIMHLEVSKYHTQKAIENQKKASSRDSDDKGRGREREASPTRDNNNSNKRSERSPLRSKNETDSKLIVTNDCSRFFFKDILSRLKKDGIVYEIEELNCSVDQVPSESITNAAYNGIVSVLLTCGNDHLNVMAYESTPDGG